MSEQNTSTAVALSSRDRADRLLAPIMQEVETNIGSAFPIERFKAALVTAVAQNPDIFKCEANSIRLALLKCAQDGLLPDNRLAALVPFRDNKRNLMLAQYIPMVQGIIQRARDLGEVMSITANCVHENDEFVVDETDIQNMRHTRPALAQPRGEIVGAYAIFRAKGGEVIHREIMDKGQIDKTRSVSRAKNSPAWNDWFSEMARKTVIRRGVKYVAMSPVLRQIVEREDEFTVLDGSLAEPRAQVSALQQRLLATGAKAPIDMEKHVDQETGEITNSVRGSLAAKDTDIEGESAHASPEASVSDISDLTDDEKGRAAFHADVAMKDIPAKQHGGWKAAKAEQDAAVGDDDTFPGDSP